MWKPLSAVLALAILTPACTQTKQKIDDNVPPVGQMAESDPIFLNGEPDARKACNADADCPTGDICHPGQLRCMSSYPETRMLDVSFTVERQCKLVNLFFSFDSASLVPEAERWLEYDARCVKARQAARLIITGHADPRGTAAHNNVLAHKRASTVKQRLAALGITVPIEVIGEGVEVVPGHEEVERDFAWNRRASIHVR